MTVGLIVTAVIVVLLFVGWATGLAAAVEAWLRMAYLEYRKDRAIAKIHADGQAVRELIIAASSQRTRVGLDNWLNRERRRIRTRRWVAAVAGSAFLVILVVTVAVWAGSSSPRPVAPSRQTPLDSVIGSIKTGECTNFTNNQANTLPENPEIVSCVSRSATFKTAWRGVAPDGNGPCPGKYSNLSWWTSTDNITVCMERVYRTGQCMQGPRVKDASYSWYDNAVVQCSLKPTPEYPYIVKIAGVYSGHGSCPVNSDGYDNPDDVAGITLCVALWSHLKA